MGGKMFNFKNAVLSIAMLLMISAISFAQVNKNDPLSRVKDLVNSDEIIVLHSQSLGSDPNTHNARGRIFDMDLNTTVVNDKIVPKTLQTDSSVIGNKRIALTSGNYRGAQFKHLVGAWIGPNNSIRLMIPEIVSNTLSWSSAKRLNLPNAIMPATRSPNTPLRLVSGNFYGDLKDEFVLGYIGPDSSLKIKLFTVDNSLNMVMGDSINNEKFPFPGGLKYDAFDITTGDFDNDGFMEIGVVMVKRVGGSWAVSTRIYNVNDQGRLESKGTANLFSAPAFTISKIQISASSRDFNYDAFDEIVAGYAFTHSTNNQPGSYIDIVQIKDSLNTVVANSTRRATLAIGNFGESRPFDVVANDLNGDRKNDVAVAANGNLYAFTVDSLYRPTLRITGPAIYGWESNNNDFTERAITASDMDYNNKSDIIAVGNPYDMDQNTQFFNIYVYEVNSAFTSFTLKGQKTNYDPATLDGNTGKIRHFAVAVGDFNGDRVRLGAANYYRKTFVKQPLVILNTPPIHYDVFQSVPFNINGCYPNFGCGFSADYIQATTQDTTLSVEVNSDWGVDASLSAGGNVFGIGVQASIKGSYSEGFKNIQGSGSTVRVTEGRRAEGDDMTFNIVNDYEFFEYPVYDSLNNYRGNVIVVMPGATTKLWIESKDDFAIGNIYRPEHEVGNVLSYKDSVSLSEDTAQLIYQFNPQTVGSSGSSFTQLELENFRSQGADTSRSIGLEVGGSVGGWGIEVGVTGRYNSGQVSSVTTKVNSSMLLRGDYGRLAAPYNLPQNSYYIIPYAYWAKNGALVLDYKVNISSNPSSFWNEKYGNKTDVTFSLPWRLDVEKGFPLPGSDTAYRYRSKDIRISKMDPQAGDTITIKARVSNYGLLGITAPVTVRFYKGHPAAGGVQIGQTTVTGGILPRKSKYASIQWIVPPATPRATRMYVVVDPDNALTNEVHEDNNLGWAPLSDFSLPVGITSTPGTQVPDKVELLQNYPNPFNPSTTITFKTSIKAMTSLKIFDALGREVRTLVEESLSPGTYNVTMNASDLSTGVYFYRLQVGEFVQTRKLMLIK
jgi:hypothetical protein